jgi:hypothetical protein
VLKDKEIELRAQNLLLNGQLLTVASTAKFKKYSSDLCQRINCFLKAMRSLQKAVNKKESDFTDEKLNFENSKNDLQQLVHKV